MRKTNVLSVTRVVVASLFTTLLAISTPVSAGAQDFTLQNRTGLEISELYVAPSSSDDWEEDILGRDTLPDGEDVDISFGRKETTKKWDLKIIDSRGDSIEWEKLNLKKISVVTLHYKNGETWAETE